MDIKDTTVIIRSAHERTENLCEKLILDQGIRRSQIKIIHEVPFSAALSKSIDIGIVSGRKWTFCIDADVLLRPGSISHMLSTAEKSSRKNFEIQGFIMDKFFGGPRPGGIHLYKTELLNEVKKRVPKEGETIRPEYFTLQKMKEDGYSYNVINYIVGIHDDEQYNFDIYRKCFVHAVKHLNLATLLVNVWKSNKLIDNDFVVALRAFGDSIQNIKPVYINSTDSLFKEAFANTGFTEKPELVTKEFSLEYIERRINNWNHNEFYLKKYPTRWGLDKKERMNKKFIRNIKDRGLLKALPYLLGKSIKSTGELMIELSK